MVAPKVCQYSVALWNSPVTSYPPSGCVANAKAAEAAAQPGFSSEDEEDFNSVCEMFGNGYTNGPKD